MKKYICKLCNKEFATRNALSGHGVAHSQKKKDFDNKVRTENQERYYKSPTKCKGCGKVISYENRNNVFCGSSCSAIYNNKRRESKLISSDCLNCGKTYTITKNSNGKYCSLKCSTEYKKKKNKTKAVEKFHKGLLKDNRRIKEIIVDSTGYICNTCKNSEWNGQPITLEVEHKDGNSENNNPSNLELLCPNCHSQTATYKSKNRGNGRKARMVAYHNDKQKYAL